VPRALVQPLAWSNGCKPRVAIVHAHPIRAKRIQKQEPAAVAGVLEHSLTLPPSLAVAAGHLQTVQAPAERYPVHVQQHLFARPLRRLHFQSEAPLREHSPENSDAIDPQRLEIAHAQSLRKAHRGDAQDHAPIRWSCAVLAHH